MEKEITTKDLMALNELMTFENWIATKMKFFYSEIEDKSLKNMFKEMAQIHYQNHCDLLKYLESNANIEGGNK